MPNPLSARKPGWLLRDHYKNVMKQARQKARDQQKNPKFNPHHSVNYNFKRVVYRSFDLPKIAKLFEGEIEQGRISKEFAKNALSDLLQLVSLSTQAHGQERIKLVTKNPKIPIEKSTPKKIVLGSTEPIIDPITGNSVHLLRGLDGSISLTVTRPKK